MAEPINLDLLARHLQAIRAELRDMQFHAENDRRNLRSQFDNLAATHGSQLGDVEAKVAARLDALEALVSERFEYLDDRVALLDQRAASLDARMSGLKERMTALESHAARSAEQMERLVALVQQIARDK
jgi:chromosome segregation ATPase